MLNTQLHGAARLAVDVIERFRQRSAPHGDAVHRRDDVARVDSGPVGRAVVDHGDYLDTAVDRIEVEDRFFLEILP